MTFLSWEPCEQISMDHYSQLSISETPISQNTVDPRYLDFGYLE